MTYCPRCDPANLEDVLANPGKYGDAVLCVACSQHIRAAAKTPQTLTPPSPVKPTFGVYDDLLLLAESLIDADDRDEASPFVVLVLPEDVRTNLERCRVALKRHRRPG